MITSSPTTWFPLLSKELIELANRRRTYLIRFVYATLLFSLGLLILYGRHGVSADVGTRLGEGRAMFDELVWLQMAGIYLFLPAMTAGAFTLEKERDTLTLLLLTTMPPWTIVVQKYLSRVVPMLCYVILSFPLMAVSYSHGGVTTGTLYFAMVLLILTVLHVAAVSVMCSSFCRTTVESFLASYGLLAVSATCCPIFSPVQILRHASMMQGMTTLTAIILVLMGTGACLILARACLLKRAFIPPRNFLLEFFQALDRMYHEWNQVTGGIVLVDDGRELPDDKPVAWRETSKRSLGTFRYLFRVLVLLELPILFVAQQVRLNAISNQSVVTNLYYLVWGIGGAMVCIHAASVISSERSRQTLDSL
ncbi:MAG: ABC transporter permease subunit, partial [Planctomycetaceae bacterium]|nr:ABC transporter permease subunit [Planctomycetaceae bacterium]